MAWELVTNVNSLAVPVLIGLGISLTSSAGDSGTC